MMTHFITSAPKILLLTVCLFAAGCNKTPEPEPDVLIIVPVFGPEQEEVTKSVDWFASRVGVIEKVLRSSFNNEIKGFEFSERLTTYEDNNQYPIFSEIEGEIGITLVLPGHRYQTQTMLPPAAEGGRVLRIPLEGLARVRIESSNLPDEANAELSINNANGMSSMKSGWANLKGDLFVKPGEMSLTLKNPDTDASQTLEVNIAEGETVELMFDL